MRVYKNRAQASLNIHAPLFGIPIKSIKKINRQGFASLHLAKNEIENLRTYIGSCVFELQYAEEYIEYRIHHGEWLPNARNLLALYDGTLEESDIESEDDWLQINQYRLLLACKDKASL
eukprot:CAMPEP_0176398306 /NCGR_PEP_ID=MMETSP0126-20121128/45832_1 /TAXON_ID=141414 ORGANISM="Strombidinopsis acuminatum, Strain SPMC142" /NCGR_SAMPLE_ID=MMETSP0126 /ASSEMBLY_ACC=CAM_ASM_000229 /LENGTH=118 /DNA_ID=CAMNT_0017773163 /DNA_START=887 /DNA_END=1243 /DNA_ORIENTATION=-